MNRDRYDARSMDALIRTALTPQAAPPADLGDEIHRQLLVTVQERPGRVAAVPVVRAFGRLSPAAAVALLLALALAVAGAVLLLRTERTLPTGFLTYHGDAGRTGMVAGPGPAAMPVELWTQRLQRGLSVDTMPLADDGVVYVVDTRGNASAHDLDSGRVLWEAMLPADVTGTPLVSGGALIIGAEDGAVRALDLETGAQRWEADIGARVRSSVGGWRDLAFVGADDGLVHALETGTGRERFSVDVSAPLRKAPAIEDGVAYVVADGGPVVAFDAGDGQVLWTIDIGPGDASTPAVLDGTLYVAHGRPGVAVSELVALDVRAGSGTLPVERWRWRSPSDGPLHLGAVTSDAVYVLDEYQGVHAIDPATGQGRPLLETDAGVGAVVAISGDILYLSTADGHVHAVDRRSGEPRWSVSVAGTPTAPVVVESRLVVGTDRAVLSAFGDPLQPAP